MSFLKSLFKTKNSKAQSGWRTGGMEDFMTLIRVYYQSVLASQLGISNLAALPDLRIFKQTLHVPTLNNKLGLGEKKRSAEMLQQIYGMNDGFFREIDQSIKKNVRNMQQMQQYLYLFQAFSQELMMLMGNLMKWKFRLPGFMKSALRTLTEKTIQDVMTRNTWKDEGVRKSVLNVRQMQHQLGYSTEWMTEYVYHIIILAKKEPRPTDTTEKESK